MEGPRLRVDPQGVWVVGHGDPVLAMETARIAGADRELGPLALEPNRAIYPRADGSVDFYELRDGSALEQGWIVAERLEDTSDEALVVTLALGPDAEALLELDGSVIIRTREGEISYSSPRALDASGTVLDVALDVRDRAIVVLVDDAAAVYPIEIDPLIALAGAAHSAPSAGTLDYGYSVAIDGTNMFVGQPDLPRDVTNVLEEGAVHQYTRGTGSSWTFVRTIRVPGTGSTAAFGSAVDVHGDWLVVGAPYDSTSGRVYAIKLSGGFGTTGVPSIYQQLSGPTSGLVFGASVSIAGTRLAVGAWASHVVWVFNASGNTWSTATAHQLSGSGNFGASVDLDRTNANLLVVGAPNESTNGRVHIHRWSGSSWGTGTTITPLTSPSQQTRFGVSVAVSGSANAEHVAIGCLSSSGTRAQLVRTIYNGSSWPTPSIQIDGSMNGYVSTTTGETFSTSSDDRTPHVAIAPDSSSSGNDILLLSLPNGVSASDGTGTVYGTHIALPSGISAVQRTLASLDGAVHRGRSIATDGATVAVGDEYSSAGWVLTHRVLWANGTACSSAASCSSGYCTDSVCCNASCGGGSTSDCEACSTARGAAVNGTCGPLSSSFAPTVTCRASAGPCDLAETCVAGSTACPSNAFRLSSYKCAGSTGECDADDFCTGSSAICPNAVQPNGYVCRAAAPGSCDLAETCNGVTSGCPVDKPQSAGVACGSDSGDPCDAPDVCNGVSFACPELAAPAETVCRVSVSDCDAKETCNGTSTACPANAPPRPSGTVCRSANPSLGCDAAETCTGNSYLCPPDTFAALGTTCREQNGVCDQAEVCTGSGFDCPADSPAPVGTTCRATAGACDVPELCSGFTCPADLRQDAFTLCRAASNTTPPGSSDCDVPEYCDGTGVSCPADVGAPLAECCVASEWADGEQCRTDYLCVDATCTERGCGDGWLEGAERCDDHNVAGGDACSASCAPTPFVIASREDEIDEPGERSVAVDGQGRVLVVWSEESSTVTRIRARRYSRYATDPAGSPAITEVASLPGPGWDAHPVVTPLAEGWAVAWRQPAGSDVGAVVAARISAAGVMGTAIRVSDTTETLALDPSIAALSDGSLIVTWTDATDPTVPVVRYRWIVGSTVSGLPTAIDSAAGGDAAVAASGSTAMIVWTEEPLLGERPRVLARRLTRTSMVDAAPVVISTDAVQPTVSGGTSHFAIGFVGRQDDPDGDVFALVAPPTGAITATPAHVTLSTDPDRPRIERAPSILAHGSGWIIGWEVPTELSARVAAGGGVILPNELISTLEPALTDYLAADLSLASSARGTWVVWSAAHDAPTAPASSAARATWGFILPPS